LHAAMAGVRTLHARDERRFPTGAPFGSDRFLLRAARVCGAARCTPRARCHACMPRCPPRAARACIAHSPHVVAAEALLDQEAVERPLGDDGVVPADHGVKRVCMRARARVCVCVRLYECVRACACVWARVCGRAVGGRCTHPGPMSRSGFRVLRSVVELKPTLFCRRRSCSRVSEPSAPHRVTLMTSTVSITSIVGIVNKHQKNAACNAPNNTRRAAQHNAARGVRGGGGGRTLAPTMPFSGVSVSGSSEARLICVGVRIRPFACGSCAPCGRGEPSLSADVGGASPDPAACRCRRGEPSLIADKGAESPLPVQM
jgi:hypothetical protein